MNELIVITILLIVLIIIVTFYLINKHLGNVEHYSKNGVKVRIEETHHQDLPAKYTAEGKGFTVFPSDNVFQNNQFYNIERKRYGSTKIKVIRIDKEKILRKDVISFRHIDGIQLQQHSDVNVTKIS